MELIIGLIVLAVVAYFLFFRKKDEPVEVAPYKVPEPAETLVAAVSLAPVEVTSAPVEVTPAAGVETTVAVPSKKPRKPRAPQAAKPAAKKAPAKTKAPAKAATKAPAKKPAARTAKSKKV
jgi:hypothetical protein